MAEKPANNLLALLAARDPEAERKAAEEKAKKEAEDKAFEERCYRWLERFKGWGMKQEKEELAEHFSLAVLLLIESRKTARLREEGSSLMQRHIRTIEAENVAAKNVAREFASKAFAAQAARKKGIANKLAKDPKQAAKTEVKQWFEAWRDRRMAFRSDADFARYVLANTPIADANTVHRWLRSWRKES